MSRFAFLRLRVLPVLLCFGLAWVATVRGWLDRLENLTLDARTVWRAKLQPAPAPEEVVVVAIDVESLKEFGAWPWSRNRHADISALLGRVLPSVVAWDILFTEPSADPSIDDAFARSIAGSGATVVLGAKRGEEVGAVVVDAGLLAQLKLLPLTRVVGDVSRLRGEKTAELPIGVLARVAQLGFTDTPPDADGIRRVAPLVVRIGEHVFPTLSLQSLMQHWGFTPNDIEVRLGDAIIMDNGGTRRRVPIDETGSYRVNYRYSIEGKNVRAFGFAGLNSQLRLRYEHGQAVEVPDLTGKILLVGQTAEGLSDMGPTPFSALTPLVLVHANVMGNIIAEDYVRRIPSVWVWLGIGALGALGVWRFSERKFWEQAVFSVGVPVAYCAVAFAVWMEGSWNLLVVGPLAGFVALQLYMVGRRVIAEQRAKEQIKGMFGSYVSPELVKRMVDRGEMPRLGGHEEEITAYFSDIQGFSTFAEKMPPDRLVELMNEYLTACTDIIQEEGGTLDKYIGDAVVAMFGAPIPLPDHAYRACVATQRVQRKLDELRAKWRGEGDKWPEIVWRMQSRIGLNSGRCIIGNMGSRTRFNYTMMGDDVNLAARMESGAKSWGAYTMCTEVTRLACEQHGGDRVVFRPLGRIVVKGRSRAVPIHEVVGLKEFVSAETRECLGHFSRGLERYYAQDWEEALACFARSSALEPNQPGRTPGVTANPSTIYTDITRHLQANPPGADWDGVWVMKEK
jgi:adenylate cyclase